MGQLVSEHIRTDIKHLYISNKLVATHHTHWNNNGRLWITLFIPGVIFPIGRVHRVLLLYDFVTQRYR